MRTLKGTLRGRFVIVTASTGVLSGGKIAFAPELPKRQLDALARLKMGSFDHIALEFGGNPLGLQRDDLVFEKSANTQTGALLANIGGTSLATVSVAGRFGRELSAKSDKEMVDFAIGWLTGLYGGRYPQGREALACDALERFAVRARRVRGGGAGRRAGPQDHDGADPRPHLFRRRGGA